MSILCACAYSQTASSGALRGLVVDPSGAVLPSVLVHVSTEDGREATSTLSDQNGRFGFPFVHPGIYTLRATKDSFASVSLRNLRIAVNETLRVELHLEVGKQFDEMEVSSNPLMVQLDTSSLGRTVERKTITNLPLVTKNSAQLVGLSPGVTAGVFNAGELGSGGTALSQVGSSQDGIFVQGSRSYENNWELDGISVTDVLSAGAASGGVPIPIPDALEQFTVQTGLYDAEFGRMSGANISVVTKSGTGDFHGSVFEFWRNNILNANDFFLNKTGQQRPDLKQNQFGFSLGGPVRGDKVLFFVSYQGTRQINAVAAGQARIGCVSSFSEPPLTNDRSRQALGQLFGGRTGALGGVSVNPDGSNISPVSVALLNFRLPDGTFLIPTAQIVDPSKPFATQGFSASAQPCDFDEDQGTANVDYVVSKKSRFAVRLFVADTSQLVTFPGSGLNPMGNIRGFNSPGTSKFVVSSVAHNYTGSNGILNQTRVGFVRTSTFSGTQSPFKWSDVGVSEGAMNGNNDHPNLDIAGSLSMASAFQRTYTQNTYSFTDILTWVSRAHAMKLGGSVTRLQETLDIPGLGSSLRFLSWPDFLLGLDAADNRTSFSNVFGSADIFGLLNRDFRAWEGSLFAHDNYMVTRLLTLNLGLRYERLGQLADKLGRNSSFDFDQADRNPPPGGSLDGYIVASHFPASTPSGVSRANNEFATYGEGQNTLAPRIGFAWQILPRTSRIALRGGYGLYYSRPTGGASAQSITGAPFGLNRMKTGLANAAATFLQPFAQPFPTPASFPMFAPYGPGTGTTVNTLNPNFRSAIDQQFGLNLQAELNQNVLLEIGYVGTRATHLQRLRSLNQALDASAAHPIRGVTENTLDNIAQRVPIPGIAADSLREMESEGSSWFNGLEASLTKRSTHGLDFVGSYTFSKTLDSDGANVNGATTGSVLTLGDQNSPAHRWGRASFDRTQRLVVSATWAIPSFADHNLHAVLGGWSLAVIATIQSGTAVTISDTNSKNVYGISEDRAQLSGTCSKDHLVTRGSVQSKLNGYFDASCFTNPQIVGADGIGTGFGNSATGIVDGPGQANVDLALSKAIPVKWPVETGSLELRAEFYNAFNHPQFANPDSSYTSPSFGVISSTAVNPRVGQLALRFSF